MKVDLTQCEKDLFREAVEKGKSLPTWERLTVTQRAELITRYLRVQFYDDAAAR